MSGLGTRSRRRLAAGALTAIVLVSGCSGGGRSAAAFCDELDTGMEELRASANDAAQQENPMVGLLGLVGTLGDLQRLLERLADVAPEEIQQDAEVVRDVMARQADTAGDAVSDPLGALASSLGDSLLNQGSFRRLDEFARAECGQPVLGL